MISDWVTFGLGALAIIVAPATGVATLLVQAQRDKEAHARTLERDRIARGHEFSRQLYLLRRETCIRLLSALTGSAMRFQRLEDVKARLGDVPLASAPAAAVEDILLAERSATDAYLDLNNVIMALAADSGAKQIMHLFRMRAPGLMSASIGNNVEDWGHVTDELSNAVTAYLTEIENKLASGES